MTRPLSRRLALPFSSRSIEQSRAERLHHPPSPALCNATPQKNAPSVPSKSKQTATGPAPPLPFAAIVQGVRRTWLAVAARDPRPCSCLCGFGSGGGLKIGVGGWMMPTAARRMHVYPHIPENSRGEGARGPEEQRDEARHGREQQEARVGRGTDSREAGERRAGGRGHPAETRESDWCLACGERPSPFFPPLLLARRGRALCEWMLDGVCGKGMTCGRGRGRVGCSMMHGRAR